MKFLLFILLNFFQLSFQKLINIENNTNITKPLYLNRKIKYCNFKCNCFFSHNVNNDNIYITNWMKPFGL